MTNIVSFYSFLIQLEVKKKYTIVEPSADAGSLRSES